MEDKAFFTKILGLQLPWFVKQVVVNAEQQRVDIYVDLEPGIKVRCPECEIAEYIVKA